MCLKLLVNSIDSPDWPRSAGHFPEEKIGSDENSSFPLHISVMPGTMGIFSMHPASLILLTLIGLFSGIAAGLFGIGGGVLIVPALIYLAGFSTHSAIGTSLAVLLPPVGLAAVLEYYRHGQVNLKAALIVAAALFVGGWLGAILSNRLSGPHLKLAFGVFVMGLGVYLVYSAVRQLP
jgi:uncharacterized membrane protein YfcA